MFDKQRIVLACAWKARGELARFQQLYAQLTRLIGDFCLCDTKSHPESERVVPLPASVQAGSQPQVRRW